jgi:hypothetical protein
VRITLADGEQQRRLVAFLVFDETAIVTPVFEREVEVSFLGSLNAWAQRREVELRLRQWLAAHPDVVAVVSD